MLVAAALVAAAIAGIVWYGARRAGEAPATPAVDTSLSDRAYAPLSGEVFAVSQAADGLVLDHRQFAVTDNGPRISPPASPPSIVPGPPDGESIVDLWVGISSVYTVSCCDDAGSGTIRRSTGADWFDGDVVGAGTRFDGHLGASGDQVYVDALTGTVTLGQTVIDEPGAVDVTMLSPGLGGGAGRRRRPPSGRLLHGDRVHRRAAGRSHGVGRARWRVRASSGSMSAWWCSPVMPTATNQCIADHGTALDIGSGGTIAEFDLPEPLRSVASDHAGLMAGTTPTGRVVGRHARARAGLVLAACRRFQHRRHLGAVMSRTHAPLVGLVALVRGMCLARLVARHLGADPE